LATSVIAILLSTCQACLSGAFGIEFGIPISQLKLVHPSDDSYIYKVTPPQPNPEFDSYMVIATPHFGVCKISAFGRDHDNDADGSDIKITFADIRVKLAAKYGNSQDWDFPHAGDLWTEPQDFAMGLKTQSYTLASTWDPEHGATLPADTANIMLEAHASSMSTTYLSLGYESKTFSACKAEHDAKGDSAL
jgi:hypothetical protein